MNTYEKMDKILHLKRDMSARELASRKIGNNTYAQRRNGNGDIAVKLHATDVLTFHADNTVTLNSGGWRTVTTKARLNEWLSAPFLVHSDRGIWYVHIAPGVSIPYADGLTLRLDPAEYTQESVVVNPESLPDTDKLRKANDKLKRDIKAYVALYTDARISELVASARSDGTAGDCWYCAFGLPADTDTEHLSAHVAEGYTMFSLMYNAVKARGYRDPGFIVQTYPQGVRRAISHYLRKALLQQSEVTR